MQIENLTSNYYYLGSHGLSAGATITIDDSEYNNDDLLANQINHMDEQNLITVSSAPSGYPRETDPSEGGGSFSGDAADVTVDSTTLVGTGTNTQAVFEELDDAIANHLVDASGAHAASAISADSTTLVGTGTDVQAVLEELDNAIALLNSNEIAYVEFTGDVSITATTSATAQTVVSAGAVSFDGSTRVCIEFFSPEVTVGGTANSAMVISLWDGAAEGPRWAVCQLANMNTPVRLARYLTPSNGSHTYIVKAWRVNSNGTVHAGDGDGAEPEEMPGYIRITRA